MTGDVWSWADVPSYTPPSEPRRRSAPGGGRPKHPVTLGHHDDAIVPMAQRGDDVIYIAVRVGGSKWLVTQRLRALGVQGWR